MKKINCDHQRQKKNPWKMFKSLSIKRFQEVRNTCVL